MIDSKNLLWGGLIIDSVIPKSSPGGIFVGKMRENDWRDIAKNVFKMYQKILNVPQKIE